MADVVFGADLDESEVIASLKRIDKSIDKIEKRGQQAFSGVSNSAKMSGVQIGAISGIVTGLTTEFIQLGKVAIGILADITKKSVQTAAEFEIADKTFIGIFEGNETAALAALDRVRKKSAELGVDLQGLAPAFLGKTESLEQFEQLGKLATALALTQPEQGIFGARIALQEALSGDLRSLQRRFEFDVKPIRAAQAASGDLVGLLEGLETVLKARGQDFDRLSETAQFTFFKAQESAKQLQAVLGEPILDQLNETLKETLVIGGENEIQFKAIANALGLILANIVDIAGSRFNDVLSNIDTEQVLTVAAGFFEISNKVGIIVDQLADLTIPDDFLTTFKQVTDFTSEALNNVSALLDLIGAAKEILPDTTVAAELFTGLPIGAVQNISEQLGDTPQKVFFNLEAINETLGITSPAMEEAEQATDEYTQSLQDFITSLQQSTQAGEDEANQILAGNAITKEAAKAKEELAARTEKLAEFELKLQRALEDIGIKGNRDRLKQALDFARKREKIAEKNLDKIEDINRKHAQRLEDVALDLSRDEEDLAKDRTREKIELERDSAKERLDIERDFRRSLEDIQSTFTEDIEAAERSRSGIAFAAAIRNRDKAIEEAKKERNEKVEITKEEATTNREELKTKQQEEIEDAQITNQRKLEDLQIRLERELEENNISRQREIEATDLAEQQKTQAIITQQMQRVQDARRANKRRVDDFKASLTEEIDAAAIAAEQMAMIQNQVAAMGLGGNAMAKNMGIQSGPGSSISSTTSTTVNTGILDPNTINPVIERSIAQKLGDVFSGNQR